MKNARTQTKRILPIFLVLMVLLTTFTPLALAVVYSGSCGNHVEFSLDTESGALNLYGYGKVDDCGWSYYQSKVKTALLQEGISALENYLFTNHPNLETISIPQSVQRIGKGVFEDCKKLKNIVIPRGVTLLQEKVFRSCTSINEIILPNTIESIGEYACESCKKLEKIDIPSSVQYVGMNAFAYCSSLQEATIPYSVKNMGTGVFAFCSDLHRVIIESGLEVLPYSTFQDCVNLKSVSLPYSMNTIQDGAFNGCTSLPTITIPNGVKTIGSAVFRDCSSLKSIYLPKTLESFDSYMNLVFDGCNLLRDVYYAGSEADWNRVAGRNCLPDSVTIHFRSSPSSSNPDNPLLPASDENKPAEKLNFFQRIIQWFRNLFAKLFGR